MHRSQSAPNMTTKANVGKDPRNKDANMNRTGDSSTSNDVKREIEGGVNNPGNSQAPNTFNPMANGFYPALWMNMMQMNPQMQLALMGQMMNMNTANINNNDAKDSSKSSSGQPDASVNAVPPAGRSSVKGKSIKKNGGSSSSKVAGDVAAEAGNSGVGSTDGNLLQQQMFMNSLQAQMNMQALWYMMHNPFNNVNMGMGMNGMMPMPSSPQQMQLLQQMCQLQQPQGQFSEMPGFRSEQKPTVEDNAIKGNDTNGRPVGSAPINSCSPDSSGTANEPKPSPSLAVKANGVNAKALRGSVPLARRTRQFSSQPNLLASPSTQPLVAEAAVALRSPSAIPAQTPHSEFFHPFAQQILTGQGSARGPGRQPQTITYVSSQTSGPSDDNVVTYTGKRMLSESASTDASGLSSQQETSDSPTSMDSISNASYNLVETMMPV
jgi:hypothetical protein